MLRQWYITATPLVVLIIFFLYFCDFLNYYYFLKRREICFFQSYDQRLFSVDEFIVLLEENTAKNTEFDNDRFELVDANDPERKASFLLKYMICRC